MKTKKKIMVLCSLCGILFLSSLAFAQDPQVTFSSTPNPVGSGARAIGMGGAFIAIADDATAASWNPAGLLQLKRPEFSVMTDYTYRNEDNYFAVRQEASGHESFPSSSNFNINYLGFVYPFNLLGYNMAISLSYQHLYDFTREFDFILRGNQYTYQQDGSLYATGLTYCINIINFSNIELIIGATLNYWGDFFYQNKWIKKQKIFEKEFDFSEINETFDFQEGWNANVGFLLRMKNLTLGGVIKTPFSAKIDYTLEDRVCNGNKWACTPNQKNYPEPTFNQAEREKRLNMPLSFGIGLSYRFSDEFTIAMDIYSTLWKDFENEIVGEATTSLHLGAEYRLIKDKYMIPLEAGIFFDPSPTPKGSADKYYGFSFGAGVEYNNLFSVYTAYQFRYGNDVGKYIFGDEITFSQDVNEHKLYSSIVFYF